MPSNHHLTSTLTAPNRDPATGSLLICPECGESEWRVSWYGSVELSSVSANGYGTLTPSRRSPDGIAYSEDDVEWDSYDAERYSTTVDEVDSIECSHCGYEPPYNEEQWDAATRAIRRECGY